MANTPTISTIAAGAKYTATQLNTNFTALRDAFTGVLGLGGTSDSDNPMTGDLDMNSNAIRNVSSLLDSLGNSLTAQVGFAEQWAVKPEDSSVDTAAGGDSLSFSALHYSAKASEQADSSSTSAANASVFADSASTLADSSSTSATAAAASASAAAASASAGLFNDIVDVQDSQTPFTIDSTHNGDLFQVTADSVVTIILPDLSAQDSTIAYRVGIAKMDSSASAITIEPHTSDLINEDSSQTLITQFSTLNIIGDPLDSAWLMTDITASGLSATAPIDLTGSVISLNTDGIDSTHYVASSVDSTAIGSGAVDEDAIASKAVTLAEMADGTEGGIISYDSTGAVTAVNDSGAGFVLTSTTNGTPTFQAAAGGGAWEIIATVAADSDAALTITDLGSTHDTFAVGISDINLDTDNANLVFRVGDASGIDSASGDYAYAWTKQDITSSTAVIIQSSSATSIVLDDGNGVGNAAGEGFGGLFFIHRPGDGSMDPQITGQFLWNITDGTARGGHLIAQRTAVITLDRVSLIVGSGVILDGRMTVWGIKHA